MTRKMMATGSWMGPYADPVHDETSGCITDPACIPVPDAPPEEADPDQYGVILTLGGLQGLLRQMQAGDYVKVQLISLDGATVQVFHGEEKTE